MNLTDPRVRELISDQIAYERALLQLVMLTGHSLSAIQDSFETWAFGATPFDWRASIDYCIARATIGLPLPFSID